MSLKIILALFILILEVYQKTLTQYLTLYILCISISLYGFSETWINENTPLIFNLPEYSFIHNDRKTCKGGGVGLLISDSLDYIIRHDILEYSNNYESLFIEIIFPRGKNIIVGVIYRKPQSKVREGTCRKLFRQQ